MAEKVAAVLARHDATGCTEHLTNMPSFKE
jgi:hypothetical protein